MKSAVSILLALLILAVSAKDGLYWAGFKMNQRYISSELCINWDKPELNCAGSCFLNKVIKDAKEKESEGAAALQVPAFKQLLLFFQADVFQLPVLLRRPSILHPVIFAFWAQFNPVSIFQPPKG
ncbi:MAG: hypothetical protein KBG02_12775 [Haliscomenobacter sp.]|nr:hypothetical protein [Haliscomenobacter sp.]MBK8880714.1 hypothetical protein [Haliscomenobacter sp.]MBP9077732.1 hypothetical protein [Haliscomenobacter sp.]MBP9873774.1 hypothetical protein [Haliscomenobacter sp.]